MMSLARNSVPSKQYSFKINRFLCLIIFSTIFLYYATSYHLLESILPLCYQGMFQPDNQSWRNISVNIKKHNHLAKLNNIISNVQLNTQLQYKDFFPLGYNIFLVSYMGGKTPCITPAQINFQAMQVLIRQPLLGLHLCYDLNVCVPLEFTC